MAKDSQAARRQFARVGAGSSVCLRYRLPRAAADLPRAPQLSREAPLRLKVVEDAQTHAVSATARHVNVARSTVDRWRDRDDPRNLTTLESRPCQPRRRRQPTWTAAQAAAVRQAREDHPRWGKDKLAVVRRRPGVPRSVSMVGRILGHLKRTGQLVEAPMARVRPHARHRRPDAVRKPTDHVIAQPGDVIQVDTMHLTPRPGVERRHVTAVDVVSRWSVVGVRGSATAGTARDFLGDRQVRLPFPLRAIQVDGGSEFMAEVETACQARGIARFVLPPRSPKRNGHVERANGTHRREFWACDRGDLDLPPLQAALRRWEEAYHAVRPHQALGYRTPAAYLADLRQTKV